MGTNFYLSRIPTAEEIEKTKRLLDEGKIRSIRGSRWVWDFDFDADASAEDMIAEMTKNIHIGKASRGWEFTFKNHTDLYPRSYGDVMKYIKEAVESGKWKLIDEYGEEVSIDAFVSIVFEHMGGMTFETDPNNSSYYQYSKETDMIAEDGSWWTSADFS